LLTFGLPRTGPPITPLSRSVDARAGGAADLGHVPDCPSSCTGDSYELSALDFRAPERGVIFPVAVLSLAGVSSPSLTLGAVIDVLVRALGVAEDGVDVGPTLTATRGAKGERAVLFDARTGLRGRELTRSDDMTECRPSDQQHHAADVARKVRKDVPYCRVPDCCYACM
jgi:hypothetical protein